MESIYLIIISIVGLMILILAPFLSDKRTKIKESKPSKSRLELSLLDLESQEAKYHYRIKKHLMTRAEEDCFCKLNHLFGKKYYIVPQVHLSALFEHKLSRQNWMGAFSHINGKSVDYVLIDKTTLVPRCAVELDDSTHDTADRRLRDIEVERIFRDANFPLVRIRNFSWQTNESLVELFKTTIKKYD